MAAAEVRQNSSPLDPLRQVRDARFAELVNHALTRMGAERGAVIGAQNELAKALNVSSTMLHRYKTGGVDFDALKARTVAQLAKVLDMDVGAVYLWIEQGKDAAIAYQRRLTGRPIAFSPVDLSQELTAMLQRYGTGLDAPVPLQRPVLQCEALLAAMEAKREPAPELFDQFLDMLQLSPLLEQVRGGLLEDLEYHHWQALARVLGGTPESLMEQYLA